MFLSNCLYCTYSKYFSELLFVSNLHDNIFTYENQPIKPFMPYENKVQYVTSTIQKKKKIAYTYFTLPRICTMYVLLCAEFRMLKGSKDFEFCLTVDSAVFFFHSVIPPLLHWKIFVFKEYISKQKEVNNFYKYFQCLPLQV